MKYCMDASALIDLGERHYPEKLPIFQPIWDHLYRSIESGEIISVDFVEVELRRKADEWREDFLTRSGKMFVIDEQIETEFAIVIAEIENGTEFRVN